MKKVLIVLVIALLAFFFIAGCAKEYVNYCPYCSYGNIDDLNNGYYKCTNSKCGKTFGAKEII